ncbi:uracil-DNA glycosylase family protein [Humibacter sp. BT305]|nr:uracil-DNA glycosylase family protein [Humibacter sp. BT305]
MSAIEDLRAEVSAHPDNAWARERGYEPLVVASPEARILLISQAPGRRAQESGIPFDDPSGRLLRSWLGMTDEEFYDPTKLAIVPMDFYYPGKARSGDLPPRRGFADLWHPRVLELLSDVRLTVLVGSYAQRRYLPGGFTTLTDAVRAAPNHDPLFPIVHPSPLAGVWRRRNPWFEEEIVPLLAERVRSALA